MPKITEIHIENLRGLDDLTLKDARMFNLIVGPSEIGKTSVLEGVFIGSNNDLLKLARVNRIRASALLGREDALQAVGTLFHNMTQEEFNISLKIAGEANKNYVLAMCCKQMAGRDDVLEEEVDDSGQPEQTKKILAEISIKGNNVEGVVKN